MAPCNASSHFEAKLDRRRRFRMLSIFAGRRRPVGPVQQEFHMRTFEDRALLILIVAVSLAFGWILWPFYGAILWGIVGAIVFAPLYRRLSRSMRERRSLAAIAMVLLIVTVVILPLTLIGASLAQEASGVYGRVQSGELDIVRLFQQMPTRFHHGWLVYSNARAW